MRDDELSPDLADAIEHLRREEPVRPEWRAALLERAAAQRPNRRRISLTIPWAVAAGVVCAAAGASVATVGMRRAPAPIASAALDATTLPVRFTVAAPSASSVYIVGDFNNWSPTSLPMRRSADGRSWEIEVRLPLGRYSYAYMIDGRLAPDPGAPRGSDDDFGAPNSVLMVHGS